MSNASGRWTAALLCAALCLPAAAAGQPPSAGGAPLSSADAAAAAQAAWNAFLAGDLENAVSSFRYLATLGVAADSEANLAILSRDLGRHDEALTHWVKGSLAEGAGGFLWDQRGWAYTASERLPEARDSFAKAIDRSSTTADQAEARLGLGMAARMSAQPKQALAPLRAMLSVNPFAAAQETSRASPYLMAAAYYEMGKASSAGGDQYAAITYLGQCAHLDPLNLECLKELAQLYARTGQNSAAWHSYLRLLALDPRDEEAVRQSRKLRDYIPGDPEAGLPVRRLGRPLLPPQPAEGEAPPPSEGEAPPPPSAPSIRVGLFTAPDGKPATATRLFFVVNSDFKIVAASGDVIKDDGKAGHQWEISFRPENNIVELRDNSRNILATTKQSLRIVPAGPQGSVLLKSLRFVDSVGVDIGDRELRGVVEMQPTPYGFKVVNDLALEEYLYGVVSAAMPHGSPSEAYKAQAVVSRTRALWFKAHRPENLERTDVCDIAPWQLYLGLGEEMRDATEAVRATAGLWLTRGGAVARVLEHENCGGLTEDGRYAEEPDAAHMGSISDGEKPAARPSSPEQLELWTHEYPPADRYCEASGLTAPVASRWMRIIPAAEISARAERAKVLGSVRHLRVAKRTPTGRVLALEVVGSKGSLLLEGEKAISGVLSPGSLRSTLFTVQPLMDGKRADRFILWGAGTGHGVGLCRAGALGQAAMGRKWQAILAHYFPTLLIGLPPEPRAAAAPAKAAPGATQRKKPKNPRWKKK